MIADVYNYKDACIQSKSPWDKYTANKYLYDDLSYSIKVLRNMVMVILNNNQKMAIIDFIFNCGAGNFRDSTLLKKINKNEIIDVPYQLSRWVYSNGMVSRGLTRRRAAEGLLFIGKDN